jgi:hypothetical protein
VPHADPSLATSRPSPVLASRWTPPPVRGMRRRAVCGVPASSQKSQQSDTLVALQYTYVGIVQAA